jgi:hypothetical protein
LKLQPETASVHVVESRTVHPEKAMGSSKIAKFARVRWTGHLLAQGLFTSYSLWAELQYLQPPLTTCVRDKAYSLEVTIAPMHSRSRLEFVN